MLLCLLRYKEDVYELKGKALFTNILPEIVRVCSAIDGGGQERRVES